MRLRERETGRAPGRPAVRAGAAGAPATHRADLLALAHGGLPLAVEVELTVKSPRRLAAICRAWSRSREVQGVLYLAAEPVLAPLARAIEEAGAAERIVVVALEAVLSASEPRAGEPFERAIAVAA
jgi:hypothetical protein